MVTLQRDSRQLSPTRWRTKPTTTIVFTRTRQTGDRPQIMRSPVQNERDESTVPMENTPPHEISMALVDVGVGGIQSEIFMFLLTVFVCGILTFVICLRPTLAFSTRQKSVDRVPPRDENMLFGIGRSSEPCRERDTRSLLPHVRRSGLKPSSDEWSSGFYFTASVNSDASCFAGNMLHRLPDPISLSDVASGNTKSDVSCGWLSRKATIGSHPPVRFKMLC